MDKLPPSPFITDVDRRFVLDERAFFAAIISTDPMDYERREVMPAFLAEPRPEYLSATEMRPIVDVIAGHMM
jgi:hypothetical protein